MKRQLKYAFLVYQGGIANVFQVDALNLEGLGRNARRLYQADFRSCEHFARGLVAAGVTVLTASCNQAGDIAASQWTEGTADSPFRDSCMPVEGQRGKLKPVA